MRKILFCLLVLSSACNGAKSAETRTVVDSDDRAAMSHKTAMPTPPNDPAGSGAGRATLHGEPVATDDNEAKPSDGLYKVKRDAVASGDGFKSYGQNPWVDASKDRLSTFAADVDTASYTIMRRMLTEGSLPPAASVRVEEYVNYFDYAFPQAAAGTPFSVIMQAAPSPMNPSKHILRVAVGTKAKTEQERKPANLVFLLGNNTFSR
jgi:Ca-activated chloride channel family protein